MTDAASRQWRRWFFRSVAASLLAAVGACAGSSDEPPIRVKNGTMELWLLSHKKGWSQDGNSRNWKLPGSRRKDDLDILVAVGAGATCTAPLDRAGRRLEVHYSDATQIDFQSTGNHTKVSASADLHGDRSAQLLTYGGGPTDYVSSIVLDGSTICTFTAKDQLHGLVILDY